MARFKKEPGFVIPYFMLPAFERMGLESTGKFVMAMGNYSKAGIQPDFGDDIRAETLWFTARPWLDENKEKYQETRISHSYNGWCSSLANAGKEYLKLEYSDWCTARKQYEEYCEKLPPNKRPALFTDWLQEKHDRAREDMETLPWDEES